MANRIGRVQKLGKQNRKQPETTTNLLTVPASILFCQNKNDKEIDKIIKSSSTNNMLSSTTAAVH